MHKLYGDKMSGAGYQKRMTDLDTASPGVLEAKPPAFSASDAERVAEEIFGVVARARQLESERDQNFRLQAEGGRDLVLKIANPAEDPAVLDFQTRALQHLASCDPSLPVPRVVTTSTGESAGNVDGLDGRRHVVRLLTFLPGTTLGTLPHASRPLRDLGATLARLGHALRGFFHPAAGHELLWDLKHAARLRERVAHIEDGERRALVDRTLEVFETQVLPALPRLRAQVIHNDVTCDNTLIVPGADGIAIIDFGDLVHAPLISDVAVTVSEVILAAPDPIAAALEVVAGYQDVEPLRGEELALLFDLVATRLAVSRAISAWRVQQHPENRDYIVGDDRLAWRMLERFGASQQEMRAAFSRAGGPSGG